MSKKLILCPNCEDKRMVESIREERMIEVKGEKYNVLISLYRCLECKDEFEDQDNPIDELDSAYRSYRAKHKMLQPEEIKSLRENLSLTQFELASLLGWSPATISRYENGALQEISHNKMLQAIGDPSFLLFLLESSSSYFSPARFKEVKNLALSHLKAKQPQYITRLLELREPDIYSGHSSFSFEKYRATTQRIINKCPGDGVPKTKLNKLLFYCDFRSFQKRDKSISNSRYCPDPYGPCPEIYQSLLSTMVDQNFASIKEIKTKDGYDAELIKANYIADEDTLSPEEKEIIDYVCRTIGHLNTEQLTTLSHKEAGYQHTPKGTFISYEFANNLQLK